LGLAGAAGLTCDRKQADMCCTQASGHLANLSPSFHATSTTKLGLLNAARSLCPLDVEAITALNHIASYASKLIAGQISPFESYPNMQRNCR